MRQVKDVNIAASFGLSDNILIQALCKEIHSPTGSNKLNKSSTLLYGQPGVKGKV